jgi:hypothetical protein
MAFTVRRTFSAVPKPTSKMETLSGEEQSRKIIKSIVYEDVL